MNVLNMQGMSLNPIIGPLGNISLKHQYDKLHEDIETLLLTRIGTVLGNPNYGSYLHDILFELGSNSTLDKCKVEIRRVMEDNYNFITDLDVECEMKGNSLYVAIDYHTTNSNLTTKLEYNIPLASEGGFKYE